MMRSETEIARRASLIAEIYRRLDRVGCHVAAGLDLDTLITEHVDAMVAEEREACANIADKYADWTSSVAQDIAAAIRARP